MLPEAEFRSRPRYLNVRTPSQTVLVSQGRFTTSPAGFTFGPSDSGLEPRWPARPPSHRFRDSLP
jgi:hypothetical protein